MGHLRFPDGVGAGLLLESAIGPGQPVVALSHMLCPGADEVSTVIWESGCADRVSPGWWTGVIRVGCP